MKGTRFNSILVGMCICVLLEANPAQAGETVGGSKNSVAQSTAKPVDDILCKDVTATKEHGDCLEWQADVDRSLLGKARFACGGFPSASALSSCVVDEASRLKKRESDLAIACGGFAARSEDKQKFDKCTEPKRDRHRPR